VTRSGAAYVLELGPGLPEGTTGAAFFPYGDGAILNAAPQPFEGDGDSATLRVAAGPTPPARLDGVVVLDGTSRAAGEISADVPPPGAAPDMTIAVALLFAVLGGLILNVMPCVLPVLFMKALAVVGRREDAGMLRRDALIYTAGVITAFTILVSILLALRAAGAAIGWGFQLQNPIVVATLAAAMLGLGLNLSGVFSIGSGIAGVGQGLAARPGSWGSFFTGVLAVVVATPCTAPFMGAALGFALTQPPLAAVAVFEGLAIGLALPYLAIAFVPGLARLLPRPGPWMERLKQILAFGLYGAMAWLLWVLSQQLDAGGLALVLVGLIAVAFAAWSWGLRGEARGWTPAAALALLVAIVAIAGLQGRPTPATAAPLEAGAEPFSTERLAALRQAQKPVFVNFTAAWCITCLLNERVALSQPDVRAALQERGITYLKADWTNRNPEITAALHQLGRDGVPVYVYYPVNGAPEVLPQILTPALVLAALDNS
jgi:thiol:disulfide interchange protein DsbD